VGKVKPVPAMKIFQVSELESDDGVETPVQQAITAVGEPRSDFGVSFINGYSMHRIVYVCAPTYSTDR